MLNAVALALGTNDLTVVEAAVAVLAAAARTPVDDAVSVVILRGFAQDQMAALFCVKGLDAKDIVHRDGETMSIRLTLTHNFAQPHAHRHAR